MLTYFYGHNLSDTQATPGKQPQKNAALTLRVSDDLLYLVRCACGPILFLRVDYRQADEMRVPFPGVNLLAFIVDCARYH
jgi:hypothetical protein